MFQKFLISFLGYHFCCPTFFYLDYCLTLTPCNIVLSEKGKLLKK